MKTTGTLYSAPIAVSSTTTVKAIAYASGMANSGVASAVYTVVAPPNITNVTPTSGVAGTQVAISGSGFSTTQGSGMVCLGSTLGAAVSTGGGVSTYDGPQLPGQTVFPVSPLLQRQDGTFVRAALLGPYCVDWDWSVVHVHGIPDLLLAPKVSFG